MDINKYQELAARAVKNFDSEITNKRLKSMNTGINSGHFHGLKMCKLKIIKGLCKLFTKK